MAVMQKKVLVVGASVLQLPMIKKAKEAGYFVGVADYNPNAVGVPYADRFFCVSTIDKEGICEAARELQADGIVTCATDMPMRAIAYAAKQLGLNAISEDTALKATDKGEMIRVFREKGVACPWFFIVENADELDRIKDRLTYPCIVKPTDNSGSRGVYKIENEAQLAEAVSYSSGCGRSGRVIIEEYLSGSEVSVETFCVNGEAHVLAVTDKLTTGAPYYVELGHNQPCMLPEAARADIAALAKKAVLAVGIENGPGHVEIMYTPKGARMIELGARMGGDFITTDLVPLSTGIDMLLATLECACGKQPALEPKWQKGAAIRYLRAPLGVIRAIRGVAEAEALPGVRQVGIVHGVGEESKEIKSSGDRVGYVIAQADTPAQAIRISENACAMITFEVE